MDPSRVLFMSTGSPPALKGRLALEEKGLVFESRVLDISPEKKEHKSAEVLALNPRGQVPTFKDGEGVVNESLGILLYLENHYRDKPLIPEDPVTKARVLQRLIEIDVLEKKARPFVSIKMIGVEDAREEQYVADIKDELMLWDGYVANQEYLAGNTFTLADVSFAPLIFFMERYGMTFANYPNLKRYCELVKTRPSLVKILVSVLKDIPPKYDFMKVF